MPTHAYIHIQQHSVNMLMQGSNALVNFKFKTFQGLETSNGLKFKHIQVKKVTLEDTLF